MLNHTQGKCAKYFSLIRHVCSFVSFCFTKQLFWTLVSYIPESWMGMSANKVRVAVQNWWPDPRPPPQTVIKYIFTHFLDVTKSYFASAICRCRLLAVAPLLLELQTKIRKDFRIIEKAHTRAFSWLKAPTSAFTFKTLLRHYAHGKTWNWDRRVG